MYKLIQKFKSFPIGLRVLFVFALLDISHVVPLILGWSGGNISNLIWTILSVVLDALAVLAIWTQSKKIWRFLIALATFVLLVLGLRLFINIYSVLAGEPLLGDAETIISVIGFVLTAGIYTYFLKKKNYFLK